MCEKQMEGTAVNSPLSDEMNTHIWGAVTSCGLRLASGFMEEVRLFPRVQSGHCVSTRNGRRHNLLPPLLP